MILQIFLSLRESNLLCNLGEGEILLLPSSTSKQTKVESDGNYLFFYIDNYEDQPLGYIEKNLIRADSSLNLKKGEPQDIVS